MTWKKVFEEVIKSAYRAEDNYKILKTLSKEDRRKFAIDLLAPIVSKLLPFPINLASRFITGLLIDFLVFIFNFVYGHDWLKKVPKPN